MIIDAGHGLPEFLWPSATDTAVYVITRLINPGEKKSPLQLYREDLGYPPDEAVTSTNHLQPFGAIAYKHIPKGRPRTGGENGPTREGRTSGRL